MDLTGSHAAMSSRHIGSSHGDRFNSQRRPAAAEEEDASESHDNVRGGGEELSPAVSREGEPARRVPNSWEAHFRIRMADRQPPS